MEPDAKEEQLARPLDPNTRPREVADGLHSKRRNLAVRMFKIGDVLKGGGGGVGDVAAGAGLDRQLDAVGAHPDGRVRVREVPETQKKEISMSCCSEELRKTTGGSEKCAGRNARTGETRPAGRRPPSG